MKYLAIILAILGLELLLAWAFAVEGKQMLYEMALGGIAGQVFGLVFCVSLSLIFRVR